MFANQGLVRKNAARLCTLLQTFFPTGHFTKRSAPHKTTIEQLYSSFIPITLDLGQTIHFQFIKPIKRLTATKHFKQYTYHQ